MIRLATALLIIGGLNWGLVGLFDFDLVASIFGGPESFLSELIYTLVGIAAIYELFVFNRLKRLDKRGTVVSGTDFRRAA